MKNSKIICPDFERQFPKLSLAAMGILAQMINVPELDYCSLSELCQSTTVESPEEIEKAVKELYENGIVIFIEDDIIAIDKHIITKMKIV